MNGCIDQQNVTEVGPIKNSSTPYFFIWKTNCLFVEIRSCQNFPNCLFVEIRSCQNFQPQIWQIRPMVSACPRIYVSTYKFTASSYKTTWTQTLDIDGRTCCLDLWETRRERSERKMTQEMKYYQMCCDAATCPAAAVPHFYHNQFKIQSKRFLF